MSQHPIRRTRRHGENLPAYTDDELARIREADAQHLADVRLLAVESSRTAEAMIGRARELPGMSAAQMLRKLEQDFEARVREEMKS